MSLKVYKVDALPTPLSPNAIYLVKNLNSKLQIFVADKNADITFATHSEEEIGVLLQSLIQSLDGQPNGLSLLDAAGNLKSSVLTNVGETSVIGQLVQTNLDNGDNNGFVNIDQTSISFDDATRAFTIAPTGTSYRFYVKGKVFEITTSKTIVIGNNSGNWFIYYDSNGNLVATQSPWDVLITAPIAIVFWNAALAKAQFICEERHNCYFSTSIHQYLHQTIGTKYKSGLVAGNVSLTGTGNNNTDIQMSLTSGVILDEDITISINHNVTPTTKFEQILTPVLNAAPIYRSGSSWVKASASPYLCIKGTARATYNLNTGGVWSLADADEGKFVAMFIVATNNMTNPIVNIVGQRQDLTLEEARANNDFNNLNWGGLTFSEFKALYKVIIQTSSTYTNAGAAKVVYIEDLRTVNTITVSANTQGNHTDLLGLTLDDHPQYLHLDLARTISAKHIFQPSEAGTPAFELGTNAIDALVVGLNAERVGGYLASELLTNGQLYFGTVGVLSGTSQIPFDNTPPLVTEGSQLWTKTLTPKLATSKFQIEFNGPVDSPNNKVVTVALFRNSTLISVVPLGISGSTTSRASCVAFNVVDSPNTTNPVTYSCRIGIETSGGTWYFGRGNGSTQGGINNNSWVIREF